MAQWITVEGDLEPVLRAKLRNKNSEPINWAGATIQFEIKRAGQALLERDVTVIGTNETTAEVEYAWVAEDGLKPNIKTEARFVATLPGGKRMSFPKNGTIEIVVKPRLK